MRNGCVFAGSAVSRTICRAEMASRIPNIDEVGQHRGAPVAQERCHHAGKRQHAQRAAGDQQNLQRRGRRQAGRQKELVVGACAQGDAERSIDQERVKREDCRDAEEAPLLAERGEDQVGMRGRNELRIALPDARAGDAAGRVGPQRMRQLIAAVHQVVPGRKPHRDALAHGVRHAQQVASGEARAQQRQAGERGRRRCRARSRTASGTGRRRPAPGPCPFAERRTSARAPPKPARAACTPPAGYRSVLVSAASAGRVSRAWRSTSHRCAK